MSKMKKNILFLGYNKNETKLINFLEMLGCEVSHSAKNLDFKTNFDLIISFGYRYLISEETLSKLACPIVNLHMSYLPWNRGAHPNFWSFWDNTPSGVTIHEMDEGLDTGPIIYQKMLNFDSSNETFSSTYFTLKGELEKLFIENVNEILNLTYKTYNQRGKGSAHKSNELPLDFTGWDSNIFSEISRLESQGFNPQTNKLDLIDKIESVRTQNNINWMNLLRVVAEVAPEKLSEITSKINESDNLISIYFKQLGD